MDHSEVKHLPKIDHTPAEFGEASKILLRAADMIEAGKWIQGGIGDGKKSFCAIHAIQCARSDLYPDERVYLADHPAYRLLSSALGMGVSIWNDMTGRTKDEVVAKLRAVALGL